MFQILLDVWVVILAADESLGVEHSIGRIGMECVFRTITDALSKASERGSHFVGSPWHLQSLAVFREADPRRSNSMTLVVGDDLNVTTAFHAHA